MCLNDGRFEVTVQWRDFQGQEGSATRVGVLGEDSALLWFFAPSNWEMLVKVLDGCSVNGRYWVFAAASTNVEYTLRVRDSTTGLEVAYEHPPGEPAPAITDTAAFADCP